MRQISAGIIIYRKTPEGPKFLLLYHGGRYWNFPKGKLEEGERIFKAALREVREETGLNIHDLRFGNYFKTHNRYVFRNGGQKIFKIVTFYLAETHKTEIKVSKEHDGYGWFLYRDANRMFMHQDLKPILKKAYDLIVSNS